MPGLEPSLRRLAGYWLDLDKDPDTRADISRLLADEDQDELEKRLVGRMAFGTAGLRARMEAGFTRMNSLTVIQASQGLAGYLSSVNILRPGGVVIGHDARWNSEKFAKLAAAAFIARDAKVWWLEGIVHTPLVPFAVAELGAAAGVMITASHNPAHDNGYKVYWSNACQIIPPHDSNITTYIEKYREPGAEAWDFNEDAWKATGFLVPSLHSIEKKYYTRLQKYLLGAKPDRLPEFVYTPLHGVGLKFMARAVQAAFQGLGAAQSTPSTNPDILPFSIVSQQAEPDPAFPTVKFPNPEEKGALDLAIKTANAYNISLVLATDPDADRFCAAEKLPDGTWHQFTGNQMGVLLASYVLAVPRYAKAKYRAKLAMLASTVSTGMLRAMAEAEGFHFAETLTGFKWLGNVAQQLQRRHDYDIPYGFEEAIGYMFTAVACDKDGVAAAIVFLAATAQWMQRDGLTPWQQLQRLYAKYGFFADANTYFLSPGSVATRNVFDGIRALGAPHPAAVGAKRVVRWRDLTLGYDSATEDNEPDLPVDKGAEMVTCELDDGTRFTVRASGTEPKIKLYIEGRADSEASARAKALETREVVIREWLRPEVHGLTSA